MRAREFSKSPKQQLDEIKMAPGTLKQFAMTHPLAQEITAGFELELCFAALPSGQKYGMQDERVTRGMDIDDLVTMFSDYTSRSDRGYSRMEDAYLEAYFEKVSDNIDQDYVEEKAREKARDDIDPDEVDQKVNAILNDDPDADEDAVREQIIEDIVDANWQDYEDDAREEVEEEVRDNLDYYFGDWLYENYDYISQIADDFGLGVPFADDYDDDEPFDENDMQMAADELSNTAGLPIRVSSSYHGVRREPDVIIIEPDSSIRPGSDDHAAAEIITPPMPLVTTIKLFNQVVRWAKAFDGYTNSSTGLHFNISSPDMSNFDYLKMALLIGDTYLLEQFNRAYNNYCRSAIKQLKGAFQTQAYDPNKGDVDEEIRAQRILAALKNQTVKTASLIAQQAMGRSGRPGENWFTEKYVSLNWKGNYLEVRHLGGSKIMEEPDEALNAVYRIVRVWASAVDPNLDREEYLKKLYKMTAHVLESDLAGQPVAKRLAASQIIARYMAGDTENLPQLIQMFRQEAQQRRAEVKSKLPQPNPQMNLDFK